jgi:antitoxin (DNA-binding transcriptional repressor) of toxin-antitoxin stability system
MQCCSVIVTTEIGAKQLDELIREVQAGNVVLLTRNQKPVARMIAAQEPPGNGATLRVRSIKGHRVIGRSIAQTELADEMFS